MNYQVTRISNDIDSLCKRIGQMQEELRLLRLQLRLIKPTPDTGSLRARKQVELSRKRILPVYLAPVSMAEPAMVDIEQGSIYLGEDDLN